MKTKINSVKFKQIIANELAGKNVQIFERFKPIAKKEKTLFRYECPKTKINLDKHSQSIVFYGSNQSTITMTKEELFPVARLKPKDYLLGIQEIDNHMVVFLVPVDTMFISPEVYFITKKPSPDEMIIRRIQKIV